MTIIEAKHGGYTASQVPKLLPLVNGKRIAVSSVWRWMKQGLLTYEKIGGRRIITPEAIREFCRRTNREVPSQVEMATRLEMARQEYASRWM